MEEDGVDRFIVGEVCVCGQPFSRYIAGERYWDVSGHLRVTHGDCCGCGRHRVLIERKRGEVSNG